MHTASTPPKSQGWTSLVAEFIFRFALFPLAMLKIIECVLLYPAATWLSSHKVERIKGNKLIIPQTILRNDSPFISGPQSLEAAFWTQHKLAVRGQCFRELPFAQAGEGQGGPFRLDVSSMNQMAGETTDFRNEGLRMKDISCWPDMPCSLLSVFLKHQEGLTRSNVLSS